MKTTKRYSNRTCWIQSIDHQCLMTPGGGGGGGGGGGEEEETIKRDSNKEAEPYEAIDSWNLIWLQGIESLAKDA